MVSDGGRGSSGIDSTAVLSGIWPLVFFFFPLRTSLGTGERDFNSGSSFGFSCLWSLAAVMGADIKMNALHSPINHRAVFGNLAGQLRRSQCGCGSPYG